MIKKFAKLGIGLGLLAAVQCASADLIGSWSFEDEAPNVVKDHSGNGHDGEVVGEAHYVEGIHGKGLAFDGAGVYVELGNESPDAPLSLVGTSYTITCWVKFNTVEGSQRIISKDTGEDYVGGYSIAMDGEMIKVLTNSGTKQTINIGVATPAVWRFIAISYNQATGERKSYINADMVASDNVGKDGLHARSNDRLWFGGIPKYGQYFSGVLDEVRIYNTALEARQISELIAQPETDGQKP